VPVRNSRNATCQHDAEPLRATVHPRPSPIQASQFRVALSIEEAKDARGFDHLVTLGNGATGNLPLWKHRLFLLRDCVDLKRCTLGRSLTA
jgi:hypothetical protein